MHMKLYYRLIGLTLGYSLLLGSGAIPQHSDEPYVSMRVIPEKAVIFPGEPLMLKVVFSNTRSSSAALDLGIEGLEAFSFTLIDNQSNKVCTGADQEQGGFRPLVRVAVPAHESVEKRLLFNIWCSTMLPFGQYKIKTNFRDASDHSKVFTAETDFEIAPFSKPEMQEIFSAELSKILNKPPVEEMRLAIRKIAYSESPEVVPYIAQIVASKNVEILWKSEVIRGLGKIKTLESAKLLKQIFYNRSSSGIERDDALSAIHQIYSNTKDQRILRELRPVIKAHPKPPLKRIIG